MPKNNVTIIKTPKMLLPNASVDMTKWAVIACDQYTSNKAYWDKVEALVGDARPHFTSPFRNSISARSMKKRRSPTSRLRNGNTLPKTSSTFIPA